MRVKIDHLEYALIEGQIHYFNEEKAWKKIECVAKLDVEVSLIKTLLVLRKEFGYKQRSEQ